MAMTGDAYILPISVTLNDGFANASSFEDIEVTVGGVRKTMKRGEVIYDENEKTFNVRFLQEDTFKLRGKKMVQIRFKFAGGDVVGVEAGELEHEESASKEVL